MKQTAEKAKEGAGASSAQMSPAYIMALFGGMLGAMLAFCGLLFGLHTSENLPPPAFSNSLCVDEKLSFLRNNPIEAPDLLIIGSSVAWRHVDSNAVVQASPQSKPLNGAFCGLHANQSVYVANWLLDRHPSVRQVVMVVDPLDFAGCWKTPAAVFNREDADSYVYEKAFSWKYYLHYFAPGSLLRNASGIKDQRNDRNDFDPLVFNRYGDGPLHTTNSRGLLYGTPEPLDERCFTALHSLASRLKQDGLPLTVVATPLHPDWKAQQDPTGVFLGSFDEKIAAALSGTGSTYWNADKEWTAPKGAFVDAIHLRWSAAKEFSKALVQQLKLDQIEGNIELLNEDAPKVSRADARGVTRAQTAL